MVDAAADLDRRVEAFESAWAAGPPRLDSFLPAEADSNYLPVLTELVRVDLEFRRKRGEDARLERYRTAFPALFADSSVVRELAFEEYRLRLAAHEPIHPKEYAVRYDIDTSGWPLSARKGSSVATQVLAEPELPAQFPAVGETVLDFRLIAELGRGAFGRVYLAEQTGLAGRRVAVKLSTKFGVDEPETLARLQHTHIVPVYSTHRSGAFQVVVMPFLGALTLADLFEDARRRGALPASGRVLADTLAAFRSKTLPASHTSTSNDPPPAPPATDIAFRNLSRFSYPEAVLWIGAKLADALAHAHDRGVMHRDIKPANVLLTDDGLPMLLDFTLAADMARPGPRVGGTPVYMAPEQLRLMLGEPGAIDGRADVFSLGVVLFEALAGRYPFPLPADSAAASASDLLALRPAAPPDLRAANPAVSPSAAAIVAKCLEPDPSRRYASARELADDLERQLSHQSLAHTREPSVRERFRKWRRRHPRLASSGSVGALAGVVVLLLTGAVIARQKRVKELERESAAIEVRRAAVTEYQAFKAEYQAAASQLAVHGHDPQRLEDGERRVRALLGRYSVLDDSGWMTRTTALSEADRLALRGQVSEALAILARVEANRATALPVGPARDAGLNASLALLDRAEAAAGADTVPVSLVAERAEVRARLGRPEPIRPEAKVTALTPRDSYLIGAAQVAAGQYREAVRHLTDATTRDPRQFWAWFNLGAAHQGLADDAAAEGCFNACVALEPDFAPGYFNRGLSRLNRKQYAAADADYTAVLRLKPGMTDALLNRALARLGANNLADAEKDATAALDLGAAETRLYFLRADIRDRRGDKAGAAADRATGLAKVPADEPSWVARGLARADADPTGAIADFDAALKLNSRSFPALQNKAFVYSEKLNKPADAVAALDRALELYPDALAARAGRSVLLARAGDRAAALRDAEKCLGLNPGADIVYQIAGTYALTSKSHPADARVAFRLLSDSLARGYGFALLAIDTDLDPIRQTKEFRELLDAAKAVQPKR
jgi:serine/threonine protein kinase/Flp pilus assembly protein TadD